MGSFVYGLFPTEKMSLLNAMVIGIIMYMLVGTWGFFNLLGWKVGEKHYRLKGTLSNLKIWRYTHENY